MLAFIALTLAVIPSLVSATGTSVGCYTSIPSSWVAEGAYTWQSSDYCSTQCSGYDFYAMSGNKCWCGSSQPSGSQSDSCTTSCDGYPSDMCGGTNAYNVYAQQGVTVSSVDTDTTSASTSTPDAATSSTETTSSEQAATAATSSTEDTSSSTETSSDDSTTTSDSSEATTTSQSSATVETTVINSSTIVTSVVTITSKTSSPSSTDSSSSATSSATASSTPESKKSSSNTGAIAGGVVGGVVGLGLIAAGLYFFIWRRRRDDDYNAGDNTSGIVDDMAYEEALKSSTNPFASEQDDTANRVMLGRRRLSDGSLADAADYNRKVLRVANPDDDIPENNASAKY